MAGVFKNRLERLGHWFFYVTMRLFGHRGGVVLLWPVMFFYVLFSRKIHTIIRPYLRRRFPDEKKWKYWFLTLKNMYSFGHVLVDRGWMGVVEGAKLDGDFSDFEILRRIIEKKKGVVLLIAHVGNWQSALVHLADLPVKVHALMQYDQMAAAKHFFDLKEGEKPFEIIDADGPFGGMIEVNAALQRGEIVTIMGDRYVKGPYSNVTFFGDSVRVPNSAYMLAASAGVPVVVLLAAKTGQRTFEMKIWEHFYPEFKHRGERDQMLTECAGKFMDCIERYLKQYPFQWYNFYNFWKQ